MKKLAKLSIQLLSATTLLGCGADAMYDGVPQEEGESVASVGQEWGTDVTGTGAAQGHESILRNAIDTANSQFGTSFPKVPSMASCMGLGPNPNPLLDGSCATDWPQETLSQWYGYTTTPSHGAWHDEPALQVLHGLRNFVGTSGVAGGWRTCITLRDKIVNATKAAVFAKHVYGDTYYANYYAGHATHIIQDTFAAPHVKRSGDSVRMLDMCSYDREVSGVCFHSLSDTVSEFPAFYPTLAGIAANATSGYLSVVAGLYANTAACKTWDENCETTVRDALRDWFEPYSSDYAGFLDCDSLPNQPRVKWSYVGFPSAARDIAACENGTLYALNADKALYVNRSGGVDSGWKYVDKPSSAASITCAGNTLYAFNNDRTFWRYKGGTIGSKWSYVETLGGAKAVAGNRYRLFAINTDNTFWTKENGGGWARVATWAKGGSLAGGIDRDPTTKAALSRAFIMANGIMYMSTTDGRNGYWTEIDRPGYALEIASAAPDVVYALNKDYRLYRGSILE